MTSEIEYDQWLERQEEKMAEYSNPQYEEQQKEIARLKQRLQSAILLAKAYKKRLNDISNLCDINIPGESILKLDLNKPIIVGGGENESMITDKEHKWEGSN